MQRANISIQLEKYLRLPQKGSVIAEYVWIDGSNNVRSKCKVRLVHFIPCFCAIGGGQCQQQLHQPAAYHARRR